MKATGIVRRIDDLGRVVIPKEIRRTMRIREGDPLEIFTNGEGGVVFQKYSLMGGLADFSAQLCESLHKSTAGADRQEHLPRPGPDPGGPADLPTSARPARAARERLHGALRHLHRRAHSVRGGRAGLRGLPLRAGPPGRGGDGIPPGPDHRRFSGPTHGSLMASHYSDPIEA